MYSSSLPLMPPDSNSCRNVTKRPRTGAYLDIRRKSSSHGVRNSGQRAKEVKVVAEPSLGKDAFSIREKDIRQIEIMAIKGDRAISLQGGIGKALGAAEVKQFVALAKAALDKLP